MRSEKWGSEILMWSEERGVGSEKCFAHPLTSQCYFWTSQAAEPREQDLHGNKNSVNLVNPVKKQETASEFSLPTPLSSLPIETHLGLSAKNVSSPGSN